MRRERLSHKNVCTPSRHAPVEAGGDFHDLRIVLDYLVRNEQIEQRLEVVVDVRPPVGQPEPNPDSDSTPDAVGMRDAQLPTRRLGEAELPRTMDACGFGLYSRLARDVTCHSKRLRGACTLRPAIFG